MSEILNACIPPPHMFVQGVETRKQEREFLRLQTHGELDDARLVDGAAGVYVCVCVCVCVCIICVCMYIYI